jgi:hypothetical protein
LGGGLRRLLVELLVARGAETGATNNEFLTAAAAAAAALAAATDAAERTALERIGVLCR